MILAFEMNTSGTVHAPGNAATLQTIARGCPDRPIRMFAEPGHIGELRRDGFLANYPAITFVPTPPPHPMSQRGSIPSFSRFLHERAILRAALRHVPRTDACLIVLLSTTSTGIFAAALETMGRPNTIVHLGMHGGLNEVTGWRSRNPLLRAFDMAGALSHRWARMRYLVLDGAIRDELIRIAPVAAELTDVLPLPVNVAEVLDLMPPDLAPPVQIGFVGLATADKGIATFLRVAAAMKARHGDRVMFDVIGRAPPGGPALDETALMQPIATTHLPRDEFIRRLAALHYVFLPLFGGYYRLAASGALIDAVTWLKPLIVGRVPLVESWFTTFGDIGHLCDDAAAMTAAVDRIITEMDATRYTAQVAAIRRARDSRTPEALGRVYADIIAAFQTA